MSFRLVFAGLVLVLACCGTGSGSGGDTARYVLHVLPESRFPVRGGLEEDAPVAWVRPATSPEMRQQGLMFVTELGPDRGMLFIYPQQRPLSFWMKNVQIPLSICFADSSGRIVRILEMEPGVANGRTYDSLEPAIYALEMNKGWFAEKGLQVGDVVAIDPEILLLPVR